MTVIQEIQQSPHVSPRTVLRWALLLHKAGIAEAGGVCLEFRPYSAGIGPNMTFTLTVPTSVGPSVVMHGFCSLDVHAPVQIKIYQPGVWACELFRAAVMATDNDEEE